MRIVEVSDYSVVIMKDSDDHIFSRTGVYADYINALKHNTINISYINEDGYKEFKIASAINTMGRLIVYTEDKISDELKVGYKVLFIPHRNGICIDVRIKNN